MRGTPSLGRKSGLLLSAPNSPGVRRKASQVEAVDVLFFGVASEKSAGHLVLRFDFMARALTLLARDSDKAMQNIPFASFVRVRSEDSELLLQLECKNESISWACYNEFDYESIQRLCRKIVSNASDLMQFCNNLKPQLCFVQSWAFLKKSMKVDSKVRFILVERTAIIHPPDLEMQPLYLFPLWKRPCFTVGKNGVRFESKKKSVDIFFETEEIRDNYFNVIGIAAQKTPTDSVPLRQKLEMLVRLINTPFEPHNPSHFAFAQRLWDATIARYNPGSQMPDTTESEKWKELGLTTTSLGLDLKVCNLLGLVCLLYFAETYPADLDELVQANSKLNSDCYPVFPAVARMSFMIYSLLSLGKKQTTWYPSFVAYPMWNYDPEAFEKLVCIGLRLFHKKWASSATKNQQQCMNDLLADLTDTLSRPPSPDGVPYVFSMFLVLLSRAQQQQNREVNRSYFLPDEVGADAQSSSASSSRILPDAAAVRPADAWCFAQKGFFSSWLGADDDRRALMTTTPFLSTTVDQKDLMAKRAEKKKLENKWEATKGARNEYKQKFVCLICDRRKRAVAILPCSHFVLCAECYTEGMVCPQCKSYALGFVELMLDDNSLVTIR